MKNKITFYVLSALIIAMALVMLYPEPVKEPLWGNESMLDSGYLEGEFNNTTHTFFFEETKELVFSDMFVFPNETISDKIDKILIILEEGCELK